MEPAGQRLSFTVLFPYKYKFLTFCISGRVWYNVHGSPPEMPLSRLAKGHLTFSPFFDGPSFSRSGDVCQPHTCHLSLIPAYFPALKYS